ncbi:MAG: HPr family phosphocarrier protein [Deferribacteraceae bacterium]|jgi:phosphocarrier protein|nr:HPr family phosphocarrier protein [Deferribacteraceae bacterium]
MSINVFENEVTLTNELGFHARAAAVFVKYASDYNAEIRIQKDEVEVNGKSIMGILMLAMPKGESFTIKAFGSDAEEAVGELSELVNNKFGETS